MKHNQVTSLSIIMPVYNASKFLKKSIESVLNQPIIGELELIIINDGSTDSSGVILDDFSKKHSLIKVQHQENKGVSAARNLGLQLATGNYVTFLDSDDQLYPNSLPAVLEYITQFELDICYLKFDLVDSNGELITEVKNIGQQGVVKSGLIHERRTLPPTVYKRSILTNNAIEFPVEMNFGEDTIFNFKAQYFAEKVSSFNLPYYKYTQLPNSLSRQGFTSKAYESLKIGLEYINQFEIERHIKTDLELKYFTDIYNVFLTRILELNILPNFDETKYREVKSLLSRINKIELLQYQDNKYPYFSSGFKKFKYGQLYKQIKSKIYTLLFK